MRVAKTTWLAVFGTTLVLGAPVWAQDTAYVMHLVEPGVLTVAHTGALPFVKEEPGGELSGIDGEIIMAIAKRLNLRMKPALYAGAAGAEAIRAGKADISVGGWWYTGKRDEVMNITIPYFRYGHMAVQRKGAGIDSYAKFKGRVGCTGKGFATIDVMKKIDGIKEVKLYDTMQAGLMDVKAGRCDGWLGNTPQAAWLLNQTKDPDLVMTRIADEEQGSVVFLLPLKSDKLTALVNFQIRDMLQGGEVTRLLKRYGLDDPSYAISLDWLYRDK